MVWWHMFICMADIFGSVGMLEDAKKIENMILGEDLFILVFPKWR